MMEEIVLRTIQKHRMFAPGQNVIAALSGGADSVALFHFLFSQQKQLGIVVAAAHFNHALRGPQADEDAVFVQNLCGQYGVPLYLKKAQAKPPKAGVEEWGRRQRYAFFEELAQRENAKIATAHTLSDNAETVLFRAARGTGPKGLGGIPPVRGPFVRPLLEVSREKVEEYCAANGLQYVTDATNEEVKYSRNRIRLKVVPALEAAHPGAVLSLGRLAADMRELDAYMEEQAEQLLANARKDSGYDAAVLLAAAGPVRRQALAKLAGRGVQRATLDRVEQVLRGQMGAVQTKQDTIFALKEGLLVCAPAQKSALCFEYEIPFQQGEISLPGGYKLEVRTQNLKNLSKFDKKSGEKGFTFSSGCDKILRNSVFRTRRPGDVFAPKGRGVTKTLKKWMNEEKILPHKRGMLPLLCSGNKVLWVWGFGFGEWNRGADEDDVQVAIFQIYHKE